VDDGVCSFPDRTRNILHLYPFQVASEAIFFQNLPTARLMPIKDQYIPHFNHHLIVQSNLDRLPPERNLIASFAQE
jgi:hypothetical protein